MRYELYIALRYLLAREKSRFISIVTIFSIGGILIGVCALIIVLSVMNGFEDEIRSKILGTTAHVSVYSFKNRITDNWKELIDKYMTNKDWLIAAAPFIHTKAAISSIAENDGVMIRGVVPEYEFKVNDINKNMYSGIFLSNEYDSTEIPQIVLGKYLAQRLRVITGDTVLLYSLKDRSQSSSGLISPKVKQFVITGIFETGMYEFDAAMVYIHLEAAQEVFNLPNAITGIEMKTRNFYNADKYSKSLEKEMGYPYYGVSWMEMNKNLFSWMTLEKWGMFLILSLIIAVATINIISTLFMVVMEKTRDIGILKSMGASSRNIMRLFILHGLVVGVVGTALGVGFGFLICWLQQTYSIISLPPDVYSISSLPIKMQVIDFVLIAFASLALSLLSAIYPAYKAAKLEPIDAIRYGG
ncbi:lipoprotein-releasing ABC transporter permease subunit [bacterium]|nr:lipoprotein-releasing ABC transporter permease subunit [bacterium]